jgi:hypothetical protein
MADGYGQLAEDRSRMVIDRFVDRAELERPLQTTNERPEMAESTQW